ncbi:MAG: flagellar hook-associated protein 3 [Spirochaetes bacterium]|nr:MAG: flagellar hook-associated protein 3 [Spirochaetota bacterium]
MTRVSTNMTNDDMQYYLQLRNSEMNNLQNQMAEGTKIKDLRDDPVSAAHSVKYLSKINRLNRFSENIDTIMSENRIAESYMVSANNIIHRVRELAIQGGNDTFTKFEKNIMADEVNQLLNELISIANAKTSDGTSMFAGDKTQSDAYRVLSSRVPGSLNKVITDVQYSGSINPIQAEISESSYMDAGFSGNRVFWAEQQQIISNRDAQNFVVTADSKFRIDNDYISIKAGDNIHTIIARINSSDAAVKASLDPVQNSIVIESTAAHEIWLEDSESGRILKDLGLISEIGHPPNNIARDAEIGGGSLFDMVIDLRDQLYAGNTINIGGSSLKGLTLGQDNLISSIALLGSHEERLKTVKERLNSEIPETIAQNSREVDLDMTKAITDLKMLEYTQKASMQVAGRILQPTLLDFLR